MKKFKKLAALALCGVMALGMAGCGKTAEAPAASEGTATVTSPTIEKIQKRGSLIFATASGYPPFEFVSITNDNKIVGVDIELAQAIADKLGVDLVVQDFPFSELVMNLAAGNADVAAAGMPETPERAEVVDFTIVYVNDEQGICVPKDKVDQYKTMEDFAGKTVDVELGASSETVAKNEMTGANINSLPHIADCFMELKMGKCDAVVTSIAVSSQYVTSNSDFATVDAVQFVDKDKSIQACVQKGDEVFLQLVNEVIEELQATDSFTKWIAEYGELASKEAE